MSREIKFRAWYMPFGSNGPMQEMMYKPAGSILSFAEMSPDKYIVEQFTGLKDSQGNKIYEGDIVELDPDDDPYRVIFDEGKFEIEGNGVCYDLGEEYMNCGVIGNIHEDGQLLEADK